MGVSEPAFPEAVRLETYISHPSRCPDYDDSNAGLEDTPGSHSSLLKPVSPGIAYGELLILTRASRSRSIRGAHSTETLLLHPGNLRRHACAD